MSVSIDDDDDEKKNALERRKTTRRGSTSNWRVRGSKNASGHLSRWRVDACRRIRTREAVVARAGERAVAARRNAQETRRARARVPRVDGRARARRLARARGSNARHIRRGAGFSFSFRDPARRQISQRKRNYSGRTWTLRAALTFLRAAADL